MTPSAERVIELLGLDPHPEGGRFRETWVGPAMAGRASGTAIYFLLTGDEVSHWHRVDAAEIWHHYAGAPLELSTADDDAAVMHRTLGVDLEAGERPQLIVDGGLWQSARSLGAWTLVGCTVSPGFEFGRFELAPPGWSPDERSAEHATPAPSVRRCVIIGRGRAGSSFAAALDGRGWSVDVVGARSLTASTPATAVIGLLDSADVVLLAVPDDAIAVVSEHLAAVADVSGVVAHVSGASGLDVLRPHRRRASVHPLVSLPDPGIGAQRLLDRCDFAIDGDPDIESVVAGLGGRAFVVPADRRAAYHAAASVAANHLTALCTQVEAIAEVADVPVDAYWRLMSTTLENVADVGPTDALTGPAARGDWDTVRRHLVAIPADERTLYRSLGRRASELAGRTWPVDLDSFPDESDGAS